MAAADLRGIVDAPLAIGPAQRGRLPPVHRLTHHHVDGGSADAPPVLLCGCCSCFEYLGDALACAGRVYAPALPKLSRVTALA